jgi:hypothetical protein
MLKSLNIVLNTTNLSLNIVLNTTNLSLKSHIILPQIIWRVETSKHYSTRETQPQRYNWHIVESGVKHHKTKPNQTKGNRQEYFSK